LGGAYVAVAEGGDAIYYNPANLAWSPHPTKSVIFNFSGVSDLHSKRAFDFLRDHLDQFRDAFDAGVNSDPGFYKQMAKYDRDWSLARFAWRFFEVAGTGTAFSVYSGNSSGYRLHRGQDSTSVPEIEFSLTSQVVTSLAYGTRTTVLGKHEVFAGTTFRYIFQTSFNDTIADARDLGNMLDPIHPSYIWENTARDQGFSVDLGWGYAGLVDGLYLAGVVQNAIGRVGLGQLPRIASIGGSYRFIASDSSAAALFTVQASDIFGNDAGNRSGLSLGTELRWHGLSGRVGVSGAGASFGLGIDTPAFHINYAYTHEELEDENFERGMQYLWFRLGP